MNKTTHTAIVIGGGIAGCSTAYMLARRNISVTLIERRSALASEASGNPFAVLYPRLNGQETALEKLNLYGYMFTLKLLEEIGEQRSNYYACGLIQLATDDKRQEKSRLIADQYKNSDFVERLEAKEISKIAGLDLAYSGLYFPKAGGINLPHLCRTLTDNANIQLIKNTEALAIRKWADSWLVETSAKVVAKADIVVIANAHDATRLQQSAHIPLTATRGQLTSLKVSTESAQLKTIICGDGYISPAMQGFHSLGATFSHDDDDTSLRETDHQKNLQHLKEMSPLLYQNLQNNIMSGRVAWRTQTADYLPATGQLLDIDILQSKRYFYNDSAHSLPIAEGLYINVGHGAKGFLSAPLCAEIIAAQVTNETSFAPIALRNALQPNRFILRKMGLKALAKNLLNA